MNIPYHVGLTGILAAVFFPFFGWKVVFLFVGGVLIDFDHYLWYVYHYKGWNPLNCYRQFIIEAAKNNYHEVDGALFLFHTVEFAVFLVVGSFFSTEFLLALIGYLGHWVLDGIWMRMHAKRWVTNPSIINWIIKNKIQKR